MISGKRCTCGAETVKSSGHSSWCDSLKPEEPMSQEELNRLWEEEMAQVGLYPLIHLDDEGEGN